MKLTIIDSVKEIFSVIGVGVISGGFGGGLMHLYNFTKTGYFKLSAFVISIFIGGFVGYISGEFTSSNALSGISGAMSMKFFDLFSENGTAILGKIIESKYGIKIEKNEKN